MVSSFDHPTVGPYRGLNNPIKFSATPGAEPFAAPAFGEHTDSILEDTGYSAEDIKAMHTKGAVIGQ